MFRSIDRILFRVPSLSAATTYYRDTLGLKLVREDRHVAVFELSPGGAELVLHDQPDLPAEATYLLVDDLRALYARRKELGLTFTQPPQPSARGYRATVRDPMGNVLHLIDRAQAAATPVEDAQPADTLFPGVKPRVAARRERLAALYEQVARTADDLPYTAHFENLFERYTTGMPEPLPDRAEVWRHLLLLRKSGKLAKLGPARSKAPEVEPNERAALRELVGKDLGRRDRLPYTDRFDLIVNQFNSSRPRAMSPHHVWRLIATLAK